MGESGSSASACRILAWFSCGAASAVAAKIAVAKYGNNCEVCYCDTLKWEHPDNARFMADVERWIGKRITVLRSEKYADIYDVFRKTGWLVGEKGARCTTELKKIPRKDYQRADDLHVFGFTADEAQRIADFRNDNFELALEFPLQHFRVTKADCYRYLAQAGIELPTMYKLGYKNNNCRGCVKGGMGYWNKIRVDFPDVFERMAKLEREMGVTILKDRRGGKTIRLYLDELEPGRGRYEREKEIECGVSCGQ